MVPAGVKFMITKLVPYPELKDSGVDWLGAIPAHWHIRRMRTVARILNGATPSSNTPAYWDGPISWITPEDLGALKNRYIMNSARKITLEGYHSCGTSLAPARSLAISTRAPIGHIGILGSSACVNQGCKLIVPHNSIDSAYLYRILEAGQAELKSRGQGTTFAELSRGKLADFPLPVSPLPEQNAIVRFLDHADRRIRRYIRAKQKLIALLEEQKQAVIHQAVTGQIDVRTGRPYPTYKQSGVDWLGDIPEHWEGLALKRWVSTKITDGPHETPIFHSTGIPFMSAESMVEGRLDFSRCRGFISRGQHQIYRRKCYPQRDDIFMCKSGATTGKVAIVETDNEFSVWSPLALVRVDPDRVLPRLLFVVMSTHYVQRQVQDTLSYGTQPNLSMGAMERLFVALPPIDEQRQIVTHLDQALAGPSLGIGRTGRQIELLQEFHTRLVSDVVTGKLDVREAIAALPEINPLAAEDGVDETLADVSEIDSEAEPTEAVG